MGHPVEGWALGVALWFWFLGWPVALLAVGVGSLAWDSYRPRTPWRLSAVGCLLASSPLGTFVLAPVLMGYVSHDTTPWTEAVTGLFLCLAGLCAFVGTAPAPPLPVDSGDDPVSLWLARVGAKGTD